MKILVCSDGHAQAENAIRFVAPIAQACGAEVTLLGIVEHPSDEPRLQESLRKQEQAFRDRNVPVELTTKSGAPTDEIRKRTQEHHYDFVAIGAERKDSGPFAMSAKAYRVIKEIEPPVLVVIGQKRELRRVLICSGGKSYIDNAVKLTSELACKAQIGVTVLHVMAEPPLIYESMIEAEENVAKLLASPTALGRNLRQEKEALEKAGVPAEIKLRHGLVVPEILNEAEKGDYDLIVSGSTLAGGALRTYIMGDVTSQIVNRANRPVLVVRGGEAHPRGLLARLSQFFSSANR